MNHKSLIGGLLLVATTIAAAPAQQGSQLPPDVVRIREEVSKSNDEVFNVIDRNGILRVIEKGSFPKDEILALVAEQPASAPATQVSQH